MDSSASTVSTNANLNNVSSTMLPNLNSSIQNIVDITNSNNAQSRLNAQEQRDWQERMSKQTNEFNAAEAAKNRDWQSYMSNTAHQREIADLKAAGLNPILSAMGGNGASVTSGATASGVSGSGSTASTDTSANAAIVGLLGNMLTAQTKLAEMSTSAMTNIAVADKYTSMNEIVANIAAAANLGSAGIHAGATRDSANISSATSKEVERMRQAFEQGKLENYPQTMTGLIGAMLSGSGGVGGTISSAVDAASSSADTWWKNLKGNAVQSGSILDVILNGGKLGENFSGAGRR